MIQSSVRSSDPNGPKTMTGSAPAKAENNPEETGLVSGFLTRAVLTGFENLGLNPSLLCARVGVPLSEVMDPSVRLPRSVVWKLFNEAAELSGDPYIGLRLAKTPHARTAGGLLKQLVEVSKTGEDALRRSAAYGQLMADDLRVRVESDDAEFVLELAPAEPDVELMGRAMESWMGAICELLNQAMVGPVLPLRVAFRHSAHGTVRRYEDFFGCPVQFGSTGYRLHLPLRALRQEMVAAQPRTAQMIEEAAASELRSLAPEVTTAVSERIRRAIEGHQEARRAEVARSLGISERTLRRRLQQEGRTFRGLVDQTRRQVALSLLTDPRRSVAEVAQRVGFDGSGSFARAFRRWTGESPSSYRTRLRANDVSS